MYNIALVQPSVRCILWFLLPSAVHSAAIRGIYIMYIIYRDICCHLLYILYILSCVVYTYCDLICSVYKTSATYIAGKLSCLLCRDVKLIFNENKKKEKLGNALRP